MNMKKSFFLIVIIGFIFFDLFLLQMTAESENTFEKGIKAYNLANMKKRSGEPKGELDFLLKSYGIFKDLASDSDYKPLIMGFVVYQRFQSPQIQGLSRDLTEKIPETFFQPAAIEEYVKKEYGEQFPTLEKMGFWASNDITKLDKKLLLEELNKIAEKNRQRAETLLEEARVYKQTAKYQQAVKKLEQSQEIWNLPEVPVLLAECSELETKSRKYRADYEELIAQKRYSEALEGIRKTSGVLPDEEIASKEDEINTLWSNYLFNRAEMSYEKRDLPTALDLVNQSIRIKNTAKAGNLKKDIRKRMKTSAIFVDIGFPGDSKNTMDYEDITSSSNVEIRDTNHIDSSDFDKGTSIGAGFIYLFSPSYGIMVSFSSIKQKCKFHTDYTFYRKWPSGNSYSDQGTMSENANASIKLINVDLLYSKNISNDLYFNLYAGPTVYFSNIDLYAGIGYGGVWWHQGYLRSDWFPFKYNISESNTGIGGNIGGGLEYRIPPFGVFVDFQYYLLLSSEYDWKLVSQQYDGVFGYFYVDNPESQLSYIPDYKMKLNLSTYKINVGFRFYF